MRPTSTNGTAIIISRHSTHRWPIKVNNLLMVRLPQKALLLYSTPPQFTVGFRDLIATNRLE